MSADDNQDPPVAMANEYALHHGVQICFQCGMSNPAMLFRQPDGVFLVWLAINTYMGTGYHFVAYVAKHGLVIDNFPGKRVHATDDGDRTNNQEAIKLFFKLSPGATQIQMTSVPQPPALHQRHPNFTNCPQTIPKTCHSPLASPRWTRCFWSSTHR